MVEVPFLRSNGTMMISFMGQLEEAMRCSDIFLNIILRAFLDEINM